MSGQSSNSQTSQSNTINPQSMAMLQGNYQTAQNAASSLTPYTGQLTAALTPTQQQSMGILSGVATDPQYGAANTAAENSVQGVLGSPIQASTIANTNLAPYENPYQSSVVNSTMAQLGQLQAQGLNQTNQNSTASGAFGGSRSGVADALTNQLYDQDNAQTLAGLNASNFTQAQNAAATDAAAQNSMAQFNTGTALSGATDLANLNDNALNLATQQGGILGDVGSAQQTQNQNELTNAYNAYLQGQQLTVTQQNLLNSALGMIPVQQTVNGTSSTQTNSGVGGILGALGSGITGLGNMGTGTANGTAGGSLLTSLF